MNRSFVKSAHASFWLAIIFVLPFGAHAQADRAKTSDAAQGRIVGRIVDAKTGTGITDAVVSVEGTAAGARSTINGRFSITSVPSGSATLLVRRLGYAAKRVSGIAVDANAVIEQNIALDASSVDLGTTVVTASVERGTVNEALDQQRTAIAIVNSVTAEQITRSGDGDAAQAVKRVSGVTLQNGKYVFVRGLGERYTTTSLDGARIPSPEPERKVVPLDLFPAGLLEAVTTTKTFTPDQAGDFSGAQVDIRTKGFPGRKVVSWSTGAGYNSAATGKRLVSAPRLGTEWLGFAGSARSLPSIVANAGDFGSMTSAQADAAARSFRNAWTPRAENGTPNYSTSASVAGRSKAIVPGMGYLLSASYGNSQEVKQNEVHSTAVPDGKGAVVPYNSFSGSSSSSSVLWGGIANLSTLVGERTLVTLNNNYNRSSDNEARELRGTLDDFGFEATRSSLGFTERSVRSNQLRIERTIGSAHQLDASFASSRVTRREPDRSELQYVREPDPLAGTPLPFALFSYNPDGARRTFSDLAENSLAGTLDYRLSIGSPGSEAIIKFGAAIRATDRDADNSSYSILGFRLTRAEREKSAEEIFTAASIDALSPKLTVLLNSTGGSYEASERTSAGYGMIDIPVGSRIKVIAGARIERAALEVKSVATSGERVTSTQDDIDVLPSLVANVSIGENQSARLSVTRTLSRPEYRELSPVTYRDVIEQRDIFGNPDLKRALITNVDARWEWFPNAGEIVGVGIFAKQFDNPIERVDVATSGASRLGFINADGATNYGLEIEVRKQFGLFSDSYRPLSVFANGTVMKSSIDISGDQLSALTNKTRAMVGQAPYVFNTGASWSSESAKTTATILYNLVGRRITAAGSMPLPDTYESARAGLDLSLQTPLFGSVSARFDARNLLDSPYEVTQGSVIRERYNAGRVLSFGIKWQQ